jgi:hypothetical protein
MKDNEGRPTDDDATILCNTIVRTDWHEKTRLFFTTVSSTQVVDRCVKDDTSFVFVVVEEQDR